MAQGEQSSSATDRTLTKPRRRTGADNPRLGHGSEDFTQFTVRNAEVTVQDPCVPKKKRKRVSMCSGTFLGSRIPLIQWQGQPAGGFAGPSNKPLLRSSSTAHSSKIQLSQLSHTHTQLTLGDVCLLPHCRNALKPAKQKAWSAQGPGLV